MATRHQRRKAAKAALADKLEGQAQAELSRRIAKVVRENKRAPIERNYYPQSCMGGLAAHAVRGHVARNIKQADYLPRGMVANGFNKG